METSNAGAQRSQRMKTRAQTRKLAEKQREREAAMDGLSQNEYWQKHVKSEQDIVRFYALYFPEYPDILAKSIAARVSGIVEKSQRGEELTEEERAYVLRSRQPDPHWDPKEELKEQENAGHLSNTLKRLEELGAE